MKKRILSLCLILCFVFSVFALVSCGNKTPDATEPASQEGSATATETAATTDKWNVLAPQVTMISESNRRLKIEYSVAGSDEKRSKNDIYVKGPDTILEGITPDIQVMVFERNKAASELLDTTIEYVEWSYGYGKLTEQLVPVVVGGAADAPDLFINMIYDLGIANLKGVFKDVWSIPNTFFDFKADGWLSDWMESLSMTGDRAYILGSDYFLDVFRALSLLPFNVTLMDENAEKLAPAILGEGETLGVNEDLSTRFFDFVEQKKWTWDVLGKLCEASWIDTDGDGQNSVNDVLGIIADRFGGINAASFIYSSGEELTDVYTIEDPESDYNNEKWIKYPEDSTAGLNQIFDAVKSVFEGPGAFSTSYTFKGNTPEQPGAAYHHKKFAERELLFAGVCTLGALEDQAFQDMEDLFSVVPCPKIDASREYNTIIINQGDAGAINVNVHPVKAKALTAFVQYCTEHSGEIVEQFLQVVTKFKTATYDQGTDRMLDIIYEGIRYDRDKTVEDLICRSNREYRWHSLLKNNDFKNGSEYIATQYKSLLPRKTTMLDKDLETWYTLPKTGN